MTDIADYTAAVDITDLAIFEDALDLAEKVGGTLGLTRKGRLVITLYDGPTAQEASAGITDADFPHAYVVPGTDSVLIFEV